MKKIFTLSFTGVRSSKFNSQKRHALMAVAALLLCPTLQAQTDTWNGAGTTWQTATNWSGAGITPTGTTIAEFNSTANNTNQPTIGTSAAAAGAIWVTTGVTSTVAIGGSGAGGVLTLGGTLTVNGNTNTAILLDDTTNNSSLSIAGTVALSNSTKFLVNDSGTLTLAGLNLGANTLTLGGTSSLGTTSIGGIITGAGGILAINTAGTVKLSGANTFTGGVNLSTGTLDIGSTKALGAGTFTITGGTFDNVSGAAISMANANPQAWNGNVTFGGTNALTFTTGAITLGVANVTLANSGAGLLTEGGAVSGAGNLIVKANSTGSITMSGAISNTGSITNSGTGTGNVTFSGVIGANVTGVTENSAGSELILSKANTFTGGLNVAQGTVFLAASGAASSGAITLGAASTSNAATIVGAGGTSITNAINLASGDTGSLTLTNIDTNSGVATYTGAIALNGATLTLSGTGIGSTSQVGGLISGSGTVVISGNSSVTLSGSNTFTGPVNLTSGTLVLRAGQSGGTSLGATSNILTIGTGTTIDTSNSASLTNSVVVLGDFTYGSNTVLSINGALTLPTISTITLGSSTGVAGRTLTLGATTLGGTLTIQSSVTGTNASANTLVLGAVTLINNQTFNINNAASGQIDQVNLGTVTESGGSYGFTKNGAGTLYIVGASGTFTGGITVNGGVLGTNASGSTTNLGTGAVTLNNGAGFGRLDSGGSAGNSANAINVTSSGTVNIFNSDGNAGFGLSGPVSIGSGATINIQNPNGTTTNSVAISGTTTLGGNVTVNAVQANLNVTGTIVDASLTSGDGITLNSVTGKLVTLNNANSTFDGGVTLNNGSLAIGGASTLSGTAVTKGSVGTGTLTLHGGSIGFASSGTNNNTLAINGTVEFGNSATNGLANTAIVFGGATTLAGGSVLTSTPSGTTTNSVAFNSGVIPLSTVTLGGNITVKPSTNATFNFQDAIGESVAGSGITIGDGTTAGTVIMGTNTGNPNTYSGATTVLSGVLNLSASQALQKSTLVTNSTAGSTVFDQSVATHAFTFGGLSGNGNLALQDNATTPNAVALSVGNNNSSTSYSGVLSGIGSLNKVGTGNLALVTANTYSGGTTVSGGNLAVNNTSGSGTGTGAVLVSAGGTLGGTGTIVTSGVSSGTAVDIAANGTLSPSNGVTTGFSHLTLSLQSGTSVTLEAGSKFAFNLGSSTATSDEVLVTGGVLTLNGQQFSDFTWNAQGTLAPGTYTLFDSTSGITGSLGASLTGSLDGGLFNGTLFKSGNDLDLLVVSGVPEPGTWAMLLGGLALLVVIRYRRNKLS